MTKGKLMQALVLLLALSAQTAFGVTIDQITRIPQVTDIKISPSGRYLAVRAYLKDSFVLQFFDRKTLKPVGAFGMAKGNDVGDYYWVNDTRVVGQVDVIRLGEDQPGFYGELFAANVDGTDKKLFYSQRMVNDQPGSERLRANVRKDQEWADIVDPLPEDHDHMLVSVTPASASHAGAGHLQLLDVYSGLEKPQFVESKYGGGDFYTDDRHRPRIVTSRDSNDNQAVQLYPDKKIGWVDMALGAHGNAFKPAAFSDDDKAAYVLDNYRSDRIGLYKLALDGSSYKHIYTHNRVDITAALTSTDDKHVYALRVDDGYPSYLIFSHTSDEAKLFKSLLQTFPGDLVSIRSRSRDGRFWIVRTGTDVDGGTFRLFDAKQHRIMTLFTERPDVDPKSLSSMLPIEFKSFDGRTIDGYFTRAKHSKSSIAPLVVLVHGGPAARDYWGYDPQVQALATNGFSVLQVNYRGSTGYGKSFREAGRHQWGDAVQRDIIAGTRWAIEQHKAEAGHICIMGTSFGAYSAVQSAILAPNLYACAVAQSGVYDLSLLYSRGDISRMYIAKDFLAKQIGHDPEQLRKYSPVYNVARLKAPVFIVHGKKDERAPFKHAAELKAALEKYHKRFKWLVKNREGHGFYNHADEVQYLKAAIKFMHGYI